MNAATATLIEIIRGLYTGDAIADYNRDPENTGWVLEAHNGETMWIGEEVETISIWEGIKTITDFNGARSEATDEPDREEDIETVTGFTFATHLDGMIDREGGSDNINDARKVITDWADRAN